MEKIYNGWAVEVLDSGGPTCLYHAICVNVCEQMLWRLSFSFAVCLHFCQGDIPMLILFAVTRENGDTGKNSGFGIRQTFRLPG